VGRAELHAGLPARMVIRVCVSAFGEGGDGRLVADRARSSEQPEPAARLAVATPKELRALSPTIPLDRLLAVQMLCHNPIKRQAEPTEPPLVTAGLLHRKSLAKPRRCAASTTARRGADADAQRQVGLRRAESSRQTRPRATPRALMPLTTLRRRARAF
jgi:hypothetical protein